MFFGPKAIAIGRLAARLRDRGHSIAMQEIWMLAAARGNVDMRTGLLLGPHRDDGEERTRAMPMLVEFQRDCNAEVDDGDV